MHKHCLILALTLLFSGHSNAANQENAELALIAGVIDSYHAAAATGNWDTYFDLMSDDAVFLGTDAGERWAKEEFRAYAGNRSGWVYRSVERNINLTPDGNSAWFDEILNSESYGSARGSGVLIKTAAGWKISQYHLTFPIPNELAGEITDAIKELEARR